MHDSVITSRAVKSVMFPRTSALHCICDKLALSIPNAGINYIKVLTHMHSVDPPPHITLVMPEPAQFVMTAEANYRKSAHGCCIFSHRVYTQRYKTVLKTVFYVFYCARAVQM